MYSELNNDEKLAFLEKEYVQNGKSFVQLADETGTYPNRLRRDAVKFKLPLRDKSAAQSVALKSGRSQHPTKGTERPSDVKVKISEKRAEAWGKLSKADKKEVSERAKKQWNDMTAAEKDLFRKKAAKAVRNAAIEGSKLEKHMVATLKNAGHYVEFHKEHVLLNERLQLDIFLPRIGIAIEVDGPSHFKPIWGNKVLQKNKRADSEKNGLLISRGIKVIRVIQDGPLSEKYKRDKAQALLNLIARCQSKQELDNYFEI